MVRAEVNVRARGALKAVHVGVDDRMAKKVEVEIVLRAYPSRVSNIFM